MNQDFVRYVSDEKEMLEGVVIDSCSKAVLVKRPEGNLNIYTIVKNEDIIFHKKNYSFIIKKTIFWILLVLNILLLSGAFEQENSRITIEIDKFKEPSTNRLLKFLWNGIYGDKY